MSQSRNVVAGIMGATVAIAAATLLLCGGCMFIFGDASTEAQKTAATRPKEPPPFTIPDEMPEQHPLEMDDLAGMWIANGNPSNTLTFKPVFKHAAVVPGHTGNLRIVENGRLTSTPYSISFLGKYNSLSFDGRDAQDVTILSDDALVLLRHGKMVHLQRCQK